MAQASLELTKFPSTAKKLQYLAFGGLLVILLVLAAVLASRFNGLSSEDDLLLDSTVGELAIWMSDQTGEEEIDSILGNFAENLAENRGQDTLEPEVLLDAMHTGLVIWTVVTLITIILALIFWYMRPTRLRSVLLLTLLGMDGLLFVIPVIEGDSTQALILVGIFLTLIALLLAPGKVSRLVGFFAILSLLFVVWESGKAFANSVDYRITLGQSGWEYTTYDDLDTLLTAVQDGEIQAAVFDRRDLADLMAPFPGDPDEEIDPATMPYPDLRYLDNIDKAEGFAIFSIAPEFPGRLSVAVRAEDVERWASVSQLHDTEFATVAGEFADERFLPEPRKLVLVDLKILNDLNLPHLQTITGAFWQPARRNGSQLLIRILFDAARYTFYEAFFGFAIGAVLGFGLGTAFAHSVIMERSLLPYVVASQTVPILAIAPMVVIWLGASQLSVAVIAAYLTFFPVSINTLRGLTSPKPTEVQLLQSYAASQWTILWKLRFPAALPYIFTALKVSATASVVGAIIGELPSGIGEGLARTILDFSSDYSLISTPKLWAAIIMAASVGILFFATVSLIERMVLGRYIRNL